MPHVTVKLYPGRSEQQKVQLAKAIVDDIVRIAGSGEESVSATIEEVAPDEWTEGLQAGDRRAPREALQGTGLHDVAPVRAPLGVADGSWGELKPHLEVRSRARRSSSLTA